jgi:ribokinase
MINTNPPEVAALGTCNIDFIMKVPRFSGADDEVDVEEIKISLGGSASNFAIGLSRTGVDVGIIARIGDDSYGEFAKLKLEEERIITDRLLKIPGSTGMTFIAVDDDDGERSIYTSMNANAKFKLEKKDIDYIRGSRLLHVTGMYKEVVEEAIKHANHISLNPGTVLSSYGIDDLKDIIQKADVLFLNKKEVSILTGKGFHEGANDLVDMGVPMVVVTCGKQGARLYTRDEVIYSPTSRVETLDTTGAGDVFAAGFISGYIKNKELNKCLQRGNQLACNCVTNLGAVNIHHSDLEH